VLLVAAAERPALAHDIPGEMRVHAFVKPEGERLDVLVRVPLALLLNLNVPKRGPGYIDLAQIDSVIPSIIAAIDNDIEFFSDGMRLALVQGIGRIAQPSDRSFESFERAEASIRGARLPESTDVFWNQGYFDARLEYTLTAADASIAVDFHPSPGLRDRLKLDLRYLTPAGDTRAFQIATGGGRVALDPRWYQAAWTFVESGFVHILDGPDHLLFLVCLVLPFRRLGWKLVGVITAFTVAHSITLIASAYGYVPGGSWFPPLVEVLIAVSILYLAVENVVRPDASRRWMLSGLFGLVHGFAFSFLLQSQLQFAGSHLLLSLLAFNVGIEIGQLLVIAVAVAGLALLYRSRAVPERVLLFAATIVVGHTAWHWLVGRFEDFRKTEWPIETLTPGLAVALLLIALAAIAARFAWRKFRSAPVQAGRARS
jgi:hydrogenase/urease accessory protein HupE